MADPPTPTQLPRTCERVPRTPAATTATALLAQPGWRDLAAGSPPLSDAARAGGGAMTLSSCSPGSGGGSPVLAAAGGAPLALRMTSSPSQLSPVDQLLAASAAAAAQLHQQHMDLAAAQLTACFAADTDGCCPTMPGHGLGSSSSCSTAASGGADEAGRKLAVLGLPWETT